MVSLRGSSLLSVQHWSAHNIRYHVISNPQTFSLLENSPGHFSAVSLRHHFWPVALGCSERAKKSAGKSVGWYSASNINLSSMAYPRLLLQLSDSR